jgi:branched-subunit amino acid aminotransferase/4-amino-4-deoxychorismate lyase
MRGAEQAVLVTAEGGLVDGSTATVWVVLDGVLSAPPAPPAVAGVMREVVFDVAARLGVPAEERALSIAELERADEVFLSNAVGGVVQARDRGGEITRQIAEAVGEIFSAS